MAQDEGQGASSADDTKHSTTIRSRDGREVCITRGAADGLNALTITQSGGAKLTAWLHDFDLRKLLVQDSGDCCLNCKFSRLKPDGRELRCHRNGPRKRGDEVFFPRMGARDWCGHFRAPAPVVGS